MVISDSNRDGTSCGLRIDGTATCCGPRTQIRASGPVVLVRLDIWDGGIVVAACETEFEREAPDWATPATWATFASDRHG